MLLDVFDHIVSEDPGLAEQIAALRELLSHRSVGAPIYPEVVCDFIDATPEHFTYLMNRLGSNLVGQKSCCICPKCHEAIECDIDDDSIECDICLEVFRKDNIEMADCFYLKLPITYKSSIKPACGNNMGTQNPLLNEEARGFSNITPWKTLREDQYLVRLRQLGLTEQKNILERLTRYGICLIRWEADSPSHARIKTFDQWLGRLRDKQNDFDKDTVKAIMPKVGVKANTGDSLLRLAPHVDGTQDENTPGILIFQYDFGPTWGGTSTFYDMASMFSEMPYDRLDYIVRALSRSDCATCHKQKSREDGSTWEGKYSGPLVKSVCAGNSVSLRIRLDDVLQVREDYRSALDELVNEINNWEHYVSYTPQEGDIVIFDNWRILHGREAVGGRHQRVHDRVWVDKLLPKHDGKYLLGIRPLGSELMSAIDAQ